MSRVFGGESGGVQIPQTIVKGPEWEWVGKVGNVIYGIIIDWILLFDKAALGDPGETQLRC